MAERTFTLIDAERDHVRDPITLGPAEVGGKASRYTITTRRLRGGLRDGVDLIELDNGALRIAIVPTRGMGLWKVWRGDLEIGWKAPVRGPVHPAFVPLFEPSGIGWLSGFDELLCRCGLESNGAPEFDEQGRLKYPLHGRVANLPAHRVEATIDGDRGVLSVTGVIDEARLFGNKLRLTSTVRTVVGEPQFQVIDEIQNLSASPGELELLYHINLGRPLLEAGAKAVLPAKTVVPRNKRAVEGLSHWETYAEPQPGFAEQVYFMELASGAAGETETLLKNAHGHLGLSLKFNTRQLPTFTLWKSTQADLDGYVTGFEPGINYPNPRSFEKEQGRVATLEPGQRRSFEIGFQIHRTADEVAMAEKRIAVLQQGATPKVFSQPQAGWTPT